MNNGRFIKTWAGLNVHFLVAVSAVLVALRVSSASAADKVDFVRDVQPILKTHCYECHQGTDAESGLRLDRPQGILKGGNREPAVVPGKANDSSLFRRVSAKDEDERMPPVDQGNPLTDTEVALVRTWIEQGANIPQDQIADEDEKRLTSDHWSLQPVARPEVPKPKAIDRVRNPIDAFILTKLEQQAIAASAEASRETLIRRLSFDLRGLPPTVEEVEAFVRDNRSDAYEQLIEQFLESPQYGERWARIWLDQARYADSDGYNDMPRSIWPYRDWVIQSLNRNQTFDEFVIDQIAGDLQPNPTTDQIVATGFHRNTQHNREGGTDPEQYRVERIADRVSTTGELFLGLTIGCARCHDHKFDPILQSDFYKLYAFFNTSDEPDYSILSPEQQQEREKLRVQIAELKKKQDDLKTALLAKQTEWEQSVLANQPKWVVLDLTESSSAEGATLSEQDDHSVLVSGKIPKGDIYTVLANAPLQRITAIRLETLADDRLPQRGPGLADEGTFGLGELSASIKAGEGADSAQSLRFGNALADDSQAINPASRAIDGDSKSGWISATGSVNRDHAAVFELSESLNDALGKTLSLVLDQRIDNGRPFQIGRFRVSVTDAPRDALKIAIPDSLIPVISTPAEKRTAQQKDMLNETCVRSNLEYMGLIREAHPLSLAEQKLIQAAPSTLVIQEMVQPRRTYIHWRGDFLNPGPEVHPDTPSVLPPLKEGTVNPTRMDLARWLVSPENPLTARVTMNRLWQVYFGRGLVETGNDFGIKGMPPTHPELLDWLASEFVAKGWNLKQMHRLIVTSATYRQSSAVRPDLNEVDPRNLLLAKQSRHRLDAELIRDAALSTSGLLSFKIGGPSVFPPQPPGVNKLTVDEREWVNSKNEDRYRRGLYTYFWRATPYPFLIGFDAPDATTACTRRPRTNTPLQALMLLNDEVFVETAQGLAARILADTGLADDTARVRQVFRLCVSREPSEKEIARVQKLLEAERTQLSEDATMLATPACDRFPKNVSNRERIAWTSVARSLLNLDEFVTRE